MRAVFKSLRVIAMYAGSPLVPEVETISAISCRGTARKAQFFLKVLPVCKRQFPQATDSYNIRRRQAEIIEFFTIIRRAILDIRIASVSNCPVIALITSAGNVSIESNSFKNSRLDEMAYFDFASSHSPLPRKQKSLRRICLHLQTRYNL